MGKIKTGWVAAIVFGLPLAGWVAMGQVDSGNGWIEGDGPEERVAQVVINPPAPRTRLEGFVGRKGTVLVKAFTEVGMVQGEDGSAMKVTAVEVSDTGRQEKAYGVVLGVFSGQRGGRQAVSWVDLEELEGLLGAIDALRGMDAAAMRMQNFEATYRTKGDVELTNFDRNGGRIAALRAVQVAPLTGSVTWATAHFPLAALPEIHQQVAAAKELLEKVRGGG